MFIRMMMNTLLSVAQEVAIEGVDALASGAAMGQVVEPESMNLLSMAAKGGWIMIVLAILSLICFYIFFERIYVIRKAIKGDPEFIGKVKSAIKEGDLQSAAKFCQAENTPTARMIEKGISRMGRPINDVQVAIENVGNFEVAKLEKGLSFMATIAGGAPMIGFLGTVTGMVRAFYEMASAGNNIDISLLSGGIYEAMITTIGGLVVGIIAMFAYNYLVSLIDTVVNNMESKTMAFMDLLNEPAK